MLPALSRALLLGTLLLGAHVAAQGIPVLPLRPQRPSLYPPLLRLPTRRPLLTLPPLNPLPWSRRRSSPACRPGSR
ncbi:hypothetical protein ACFSC4_12655 [Deinococcus malanensis]|uniref:hypothetical protein n=1 Tax=Deinococcus malanensis TaxID=1706855 RepID=UPI00363B76D8